MSNIPTPVTYTPKTLEQAAFTMLEMFVKEHFPSASMRNTLNKGSASSSDVADAVLTLGGREYLIESRRVSRSPVRTFASRTRQ